MQTTQQLYSHQVVNIEYGGFHPTSHYPRWLDQMGRHGSTGVWAWAQQGTGQRGALGAQGNFNPHHYTTLLHPFQRQTPSLHSGQPL